MNEIFRKLLTEHFGFTTTFSGTVSAVMHDSEIGEIIVIQAKEETNDDGLPKLVFYKWEESTDELYDPISLDEFILWYNTSLSVV